MKWVVFRTAGEERTGVLVGEQIYSLAAQRQLSDLLEEPGQLVDAGERVIERPDSVVDLATVDILAPIPRPPSVRDFFGFEQHATAAARAFKREMSPFWYEAPAFYFSNPAAIIGPYGSVTRPRECDQLDFELEVAAVVVGYGRDLNPSEAEGHIAGYLIMNDWSARDIQAREKRVGMGSKAKDFATAIGPWLVTPDELEPYRAGAGYDLAMAVSVNGLAYSNAKWSDMYFSLADMVAYASRDTEVRPGDICGSGTAGTGCILELSLTNGEDAYPWLVEGDVVEMTIDGLGMQRQTVGPPLSA